MERVYHEPPIREHRLGAVPWLVVMSLAAVVTIGAMAWSFFPGFSRGLEEDDALTCEVQRSNFVHEINERGNVESASNVEVRCEVQAQNSAGTRILEVISEGSYVQKGDRLCRLDDSALKLDAMKQQIAFHTSEAALIQAKNERETAEIALEEYRNGKLRLDKEQIESDIFNAEEYVKRAKDYAVHSKKLEKRGYINKVTMEADLFAEKKALEDRKAANTKKQVLLDYTSKKMEKQLDSDIRTTAAKAAAQEATHRLDKERLDQIQTQIGKCTIRAPEPGQVVYANNNERFGGQETIIEEGATVRERQVLFRLPDPKRMQVKAKVGESKIATVREGQTVVIRLDAYPDLELAGVVQKVNEYPAASAWWGANVKEYETIVTIQDSPVTLKPGLTAEVRVCVARQPDVLQVPVLSVIEHGGKHYCMLWTSRSWEPREVKIGLSNDSRVVIQDGLAEGDLVARSASSLRDKAALPELPADLPKPPAAGSKAAPNPGKPHPGAGKPSGEPAGKVAAKAPAGVSGKNVELPQAGKAKSAPATTTPSGAASRAGGRP
jgi:HlyD family secretion protein